ncbi:DUF4349 domain-containing protein [Streptomyces sp. NPDC046942]|uniref:DUF4349 domain-containing protein n=1 Tax=Streptomyces sp. NPDC046942 TaxID=3155137 RepID=UPI0033ED4D73
MRPQRSARPARPTGHARSAHRSVRPLAGLLLAASLALAGCGGAADSGGGASAKSAADTGARQPGAGGSGAADSARSPRRTPGLAPNAVIRTASLTIEVKDADKALAEARTTAESAGGYVGEETTGRDADGHERTRVVLRVPSARYDEVLAGLQGTGRLVERTAKAEDVTDQVVDVDSRVKSQRASVDRIRTLMDRAAKLSDVVSLEGELSSREADLESLLAQQASLKDRTSLATITLSLSEKPVHKAAGDGTPGLGDALAGGWHVFVTLLRWIALALGAALPFAAFTALSALVWLRVVRPRLPRRREPAPAMTALGPLPSARPVPESSGEADRG